MSQPAMASAQAQVAPPAVARPATAAAHPAAPAPTAAARRIRLVPRRGRRRWVRQRLAAPVILVTPPGERSPGPALRTVVRTLVKLADWATRLAGTGRESITGPQLRALVAASIALDDHERRIIDEVLSTGVRSVREVMVPRTDVVFLAADLSLAAAVTVARDTAVSRFPVVDGSHDDVIGFVHSRDLLIRPEPDPVRLVGELAREIKRLPAGKRLLPALGEMRREGQHLAVVVDEYGGTAGIVTLEDLIEELVGEIHDEYHPAPPRGGSGTPPPEVEGRLNLADFAELTGLALPPGPYETVAGFLMARLGRIPVVGDEVRLDDSGWRLAVAARDGRRVARVALHPPARSLPAQRDP